VDLRGGVRLSISPADDFERLNDWNLIFFFGCDDSTSTGGAVVTIEGAGTGAISQQGNAEAWLC